MKFRLTTKFTPRGIIFRLLAVLTFAVGLSLVRNWQAQSELVPSRFLVHLPNECQPCKSLQKSDGDSEKNACFIEGEHNGVELNNAVLIGFQLHGNNFKNAHIINSDFSNSNLSRTNFSGATTFYSNFSGTNLSKANLTGARFHASDITSANLENATIVRANLAYSDLNDSRLYNANFKDTNLGDADLETSIGLTYEQLEKAVINEFTTLPPRLEKQKEKLLEKSRRNLERLKQEMSKDEFEAYFIGNF
jgi:hypothetical protein